MYGRNHGQAMQDVHHSIGDSGVKIIFGGIIFLGLVAFVSYIIDNQDISRTAAWPTAPGTLQEIGNQGANLPVLGSFLPIVCPYAKYSYNVNGKTFQGAKYGGPCLSYIRALTYHAPEMEKVDVETLMKEIEQSRASRMAAGKSIEDELTESLTQGGSFGVKYKPVRVRFDKDNQANSLLDPDVLQTDKSQLYTSIALIVLGSILLGGTYLNAYMAKANAEDPSLTLEGALAAQKQYRSGSRR